MTKRRRTPPRALPISFALALAGLGLSAVLEVQHIRAYKYPAASSFCAIGETLDCTTVALSKASVLLGVPLPLWGMAGFIGLATAAWARSRLLVPLSAAAALASVALLVVELAAVGRICLLCEGVHLVSLALFAVAWKRRHTLKPSFDRISVARDLGIPGAVVLGAFFLVPPYFKLFSWRAGVDLPHGMDEQGHPWIGAEAPAIVLHEYVDYRCPHCAIASSRTRELVTRHPDEVRLVRHQQPRTPCGAVGTVVCEQARAAVCAAEQNKFWEMDTWLFQHAPGGSRLDYERAATEVGMDYRSLQQCMDRPETYARVDGEVSDAIELGITATPAYAIDGVPMTPPEANKRLASVL